MFLNLNDIVSWLLYYKYAILFPITIIEGPIITIIAGFLSSQGYFNIFSVYGIVVAGDIFGDIIYYLIGSHGGRRFINRWGYLFGLNIEKIAKLENHFANHSGKTLLFGKLSHAIGAPILVAAGMAKIPLEKFVWFNFWATLPKSLALLVVGYYFGRAYQQIDRYIGYANLIIFSFVIIAIIIYLFIKKIKKP